MKKVLIAGFRTGFRCKENPTEMIINYLKDKQFQDFEINALLFENIYSSIDKKIEEIFENDRYDYFILLGAIKGKKSISIERLTTNLDDCNVKDRTGKRRVNQIIALDGKAAYFNSLNTDNIYKKIKDIGMSVRYSNFAGNYLCNHASYYFSYMIEKLGLNTKVGFFHIPYADKKKNISNEKLYAFIEILIEDIKAKVG